MNLTMTSDFSCKSMALRNASQSENTKLAYQKSWNHFNKWCSDIGLYAIQATPHDVIRFFMVISGFDQSAEKSHFL